MKRPRFVTSDSPGRPGALVDPVAECDHASPVAGVRERGACGSTPRCVAELAVEGQAGLGLAVLGFGQDARGELYLLGSGTGVVDGTSGVVLRIAPAGDDGGEDEDG